MRKKRSETLIDKARDAVAKIEEIIRGHRIYLKEHPSFVAEHRQDVAKRKADLAKNKTRKLQLDEIVKNQTAWQKWKGTFREEEQELRVTIGRIANFWLPDPPSPPISKKTLTVLQNQLADARNNLDKEVEKKELRGQKKRAKELEIAARTKAKINKEQQTKAKASAFDNEIRRGTDTIKSSLKPQIAANPHCPYCLSKITFSSCHADHIYPVNKGGLTTDANIVLVCKACNLKKRDLTLRQFCKKSAFSFGEVCRRLEALHKDI